MAGLDPAIDGDEEVLRRTADLQAANAELGREIGERARTEDKLEEAERANQAKSRFLAAAAHDLRQPLQSMFLFASSLHRSSPSRRASTPRVLAFVLKRLIGD